MSTKKNLLSKLEGFIRENEYTPDHDTAPSIISDAVRTFVTELINDNFSEQTGWSDHQMEVMFCMGLLNQNDLNMDKLAEQLKNCNAEDKFRRCLNWIRENVPAAPSTDKPKEQ